MIISGGHGGFRICQGGGRLVLPLMEQVEILSLEVMTLDIITPEIYTKPGVPIVVDGVAQVKIKGTRSRSARPPNNSFQKAKSDQGNRPTDRGRSPAGDHRTLDRGGDLPQPRPVRGLGARGGGGGSCQHGPRDRLLHLEGHQGQPRISRGPGQPKTAEVKRDAIIAQAEADRDASIRSAQPGSPARSPSSKPRPRSPRPSATTNRTRPTTTRPSTHGALSPTWPTTSRKTAPPRSSSAKRSRSPSSRRSSKSRSRSARSSAAKRSSKPP